MTGPTLAQRLEHGWALIDEANDAGDHIEAQRLTDHFLTLIVKYEIEQEPTLWNSPAMHAWEPRTSSRPESTVQRGHGAITQAQGVLLL